MWTNPKGFTFQGNHYKVNNALYLRANPEATSTHHDCGGGEKQTLRVVANMRMLATFLVGPKPSKPNLSAKKALQ